MKTAIYNKILEKRARLLDKKLLELQDADAYQFIDLDVGLLIRERETYRMALREAHSEIERVSNEDTAHVRAMIEELLDDKDIG